MNFDLLVHTIHTAHSTLQQSALKSINKHLTIRNWLVGFYIVEFEQNGEDRAAYGKKLLFELAKKINIKGLSETNLKLNRQFYHAYPQIHQTLRDELKKIGFSIHPIRQLLSDELQQYDNEIVKTSQVTTDEFSKNIPNKLQVDPERLLTNISFTHFTLLFPIEEPLKRTFYELECIKGIGV
jgi:hypothetical protein